LFKRFFALLLTLFFGFAALGVYGQETGGTSATPDGAPSGEAVYGRFAVGFGAEVNMNTRSGAALGVHLGADYALNDALAAGLKAGLSHNFDNILTVEAEAYLRWYAFAFRAGLRLFAQADMGASFVREKDTAWTPVLGGLSAGLDIPLTKKLYIEPYVRGGYPFAFGAGVAVRGKLAKILKDYL
jgi:hypothetical protein